MVNLLSERLFDILKIMRKVVQRDYKKFSENIYNFWNDNKKMPNFKEMSFLFGVSSKDTVHRIVKDLVNMEYISKDSTGKIIPTQESILNKTEVKELKVIKINKKINNSLTFQAKENGKEFGILKNDYILVNANKKPKKDNLIITDFDNTWQLNFYNKNNTKANDDKYFVVISVIRNYQE